MKLYFAIIIIALSSAFGFGQTAEFSIDKSVHKFPKTYEGTLLTHNYIVTNTGDAPLVISNYNVSCSCTTVEIPEEPVLPGDSYSIKVTFDTKGKYYFQDRIIYFVTNTKKRDEHIRFKVNVIPKNE